MTTFEHAMLGGSLALALGCHKRRGWALIATAAVAGAIPDWDGLSYVFGGLTYARVHRVWGHNLLVASCTGAWVGALGYFIQLSGRVRGDRLVPGPNNPDRVPTGLHVLAEWMLVGVLAGLIHLPADVICSGREGFTDWPLKLLWPFSQHGWAFPIVPWGDVGATLIFVAEMFAIYRWPKFAQSIACLTLLAVHAYVGVRWFLGGV